MKKLLIIALAAAMTLSILILPASATFSDVPSNAWYYSDINDVQK